MTFWSGETLKANPGVISDFDPDRVDCNSYTVRMGNKYFRTSEIEGVTSVKKSLNEGETFAIPAGQFAYLLSKERVSIPTSTMGFISMRTGFKFEGLINVSGFNVDPGYSGLLLFAVYNAGSSPVLISENQPIFKIWFASIDKSDSEMYYKKGGIRDIDNTLIRGMSREILSLQGLSEKLRTMQSTIDARFAEQKSVSDNLSFVWRAIMLGVVLSIFTFSLPQIWAAGKKLAEQSLSAPHPAPNAANTPSTPAKLAH